MTHKKPYAILRCERLKTWAAITEAGRHNVRDQYITTTVEGRPPPIELFGPRGVALHTHARETLKDLKINPGPDQVLAVEYVLSASPEWFIGKNEKDIEKWLAANIKFLKKRHGRGLLSVQLHIDEGTPHIHAIALPIYRGIKRKRGRKPTNVAALQLRIQEEAGARPIWRLSFDRVMGKGCLALRNLQTEYWQSVMHLGLARGEGTVGQRKRHTPLKIYRKELDDRKSELEHYGEQQRERKEALERAESELAFRRQEFSDAVDRLRRDENTAKIIAEANKREQQHIQKELAKIAADQQKIRRDQEHVFAQLAEVAREKAEIDRSKAEVAEKRSDLERRQHNDAIRNTLLTRQLESGRATASDIHNHAETETEKYVARQPWPKLCEVVPPSWTVWRLS